MLFVVQYTGPFGYLKPWTAVRDGETFSQQFLTPSVIEGMRQKLEVSAILRHKLTYLSLSMQQEQTQPRGWEFKNKAYSRPRAILVRGVMIQPRLTLAFATAEDAQRAAEQHVCLCRNEDILLPISTAELTEADFDALPGFELLFKEAGTAGAFLVGYNRFAEGAPMYGQLQITGNPLSLENALETL